MADRSALSPERATQLLSNFARQGVMATWQARLVELQHGSAHIELPFSDAVCQQQGFFHGGVIGAIADSAGGYASLTTTDAPDVVTVEYKINFLRPASGALLLAKGSVVRTGKSLIVTQASVDVETPDGWRSCALMQQTVMPVFPQGSSTQMTSSSANR